MRIKELAKKFKKEIRENDLLYDLLCLGAGMAVISFPPLGAAAILVKGAMIAEKKKKDEKIRQSFYLLKKKGLIDLKTKKGEVLLSLTEKGKREAELEKISRILCGKTERKTNWDKKWRIVMFDVPANKRQARDALRHLLKRLGFFQLQKSVWLCPMECSKEIQYLKSFFLLDRNELRYIESDNIGEDMEFKKHFNLV